MKGTIIMTKEQQSTYNLAMEVMHDRLTIAEFSVLIKRSYRQAQRILNRIQVQGMFGVRHGNTGKTPINKYDPEIKAHTQSLLKHKYYDFNCTHALEKLRETEGITLGLETLRKWATEIDSVKMRKRRSFKRAHKPRPRMPKRGMLVQFDGSEHDWFSGQGPMCTLIGGIDDATGEVLGLEFFPAEDTLSCLKVMKDIINGNGVPEAFYLDQGACFGKTYREQGSTQVGRALGEVGCRMILAHSPQAKGRIERLWGTLQDRLIAELRIREIKRIPSANEFLKEHFIKDYNLKFAIPPRHDETAFREYSSPDNLRNIFCIKEPRKIAAGNVFSLDNQSYVISEKKDLRYRTMIVRYHFDDTYDFEVYGRKVEVTKVEKINRGLKPNAA